MVDRAERISELLRRLTDAPSCATAEEAMTLLETTLNDVENQMSGVPFNPNYPMDDGRMYAPREDARREVEGHPDLLRYRSRKHNIYVSKDGALRIEEVRERLCLLNKPGQSGRTIQL
jgi:hypothetical protein